MSQNLALRSSVESTPDSDDHLRLEGYLPYKLSVLASEISQAFARVHGEKFGLAVPEWRVLATLGQFGTMTAKQICQHSRMHKTTVSRAVAALEKRKLVALRTNKEDMREVFLMLSEEGGKLYFRLVPIARGFEEALCQNISPDDKAHFEKVICQISSRVEAINLS